MLAFSALRSQVPRIQFGTAEHASTTLSHHPLPGSSFSALHPLSDRGAFAHVPSAPHVLMGGLARRVPRPRSHRPVWRQVDGLISSDVGGPRGLEGAEGPENDPSLEDLIYRLLIYKPPSFVHERTSSEKP